ncbi:MAG: hypothetical protein VXX57_01555 [Cyanobacteriota bacterium]|nr:hypothetical protein [Cyanobacteriota bacterium]
MKAEDAELAIVEPRLRVSLARIESPSGGGVETLWLLRRSADGGTDYVCFRGDDEPVEVLEGYHFPPQMPLIKRRTWLNRSEAQTCRCRLEGSEGFHHGPPLF